MIPEDTSPSAWEAYWRRLREMTPGERTQIIANLNELSESFQRSTILATHPEWNETQIRYEMARRKFGDDLARRLFPE